jgi:hypothetical protein
MLHASSPASPLIVYSMGLPLQLLERLMDVVADFRLRSKARISAFDFNY